MKANRGISLVSLQPNTTKTMLFDVRAKTLLVRVDLVESWSFLCCQSDRRFSGLAGRDQGTQTLR